MPTIHDPVAFTIIGLAIRWYALFILAGILTGVAVLVQLADRRGMDAAFILDVVPWLTLIAIVGARAYYVLLRWSYFRDHPGEIINVRLGGLTIHGALIAATVAFWIICRRRGQPFLQWGDLMIAAVPIGQAIGRLGNWANQEAFGTPTSLPWAVTIDPDRRPARYADHATFHPTFLYEGLLDLALAALLIWIVLRIPRDPRLRVGDAIWAYCVGYGSIRFAVEHLRTDSLTIGPWPAAYWLSLALVAVGISGWIVSHRVLPRVEPRASAA